MKQAKRDVPTGKPFMRALRRLRRGAKPAFPVRIAFVPRAGKWRRYFGNSQLMKPEKGKPYFLIEIVDDTEAGWIGEQLMVDTLTHEWSHCLAWNYQMERDDWESWHPDDWGPFFAQAYRAAYKTK